MPVYEYQCAACSHAFEEWQKITDSAIKTCPKCGKDAVERLISQTAFLLKGGGWYKDLYSSSKSNGASGDSGGSSASADSSKSSDSASTSKASESKSTPSTQAASSSTASSSGSSGSSSGSSGGTPSSSK